ncbi:hypothetical protein KCP78_11455 [Salmonella enterica subsp. enterica]|nr:hypothetical protein KCP78_11455 [Salmonella enterica subsp. enterica]
MIGREIDRGRLAETTAAIKVYTSSSRKILLARDKHYVSLSQPAVRILAMQRANARTTSGVRGE